jgi:hypothetical protein
MSVAKTLDSPVAVDFSVESQEHSPFIDQLSEPMVGKWNVLVSQTTWEKGALILRWRNELIAANVPGTAYADDAWAKRVGNVSAQHVGRLRRVAERFGEKNKNYAGLYWSHFYAALDWDDAEMWLEGAVQNDWSVAQMRMQRWETLGGTAEHQPHEVDVIVAELDEDAYSRKTMPERIEGRNVEIGAADALDNSSADSVTTANPAVKPSKKKEQTKKDKAKQIESNGDALRTGELLMSLKGIANFPVALAESLELVKVAILNHKLAGWKAVSAEHVCRTLETLKMLTAAED